MYYTPVIARLNSLSLSQSGKPLLQLASVLALGAHAEALPSHPAMLVVNERPSDEDIARYQQASLELLPAQGTVRFITWATTSMRVRHDESRYRVEGSKIQLCFETEAVPHPAKRPVPTLAYPVLLTMIIPEPLPQKSYEIEMFGSCTALSAVQRQPAEHTEGK